MAAACAPQARPSTSGGGAAGAGATAGASAGASAAGPFYTASAYIDDQLVASTDCARYVAHKLWFPPAAIDGRFLSLGARAWK